MTVQEITNSQLHSSKKMWIKDLSDWGGGEKCGVWKPACWGGRLQSLVMNLKVGGKQVLTSRMLDVSLFMLLCCFQA